ncbi:MAG: sugar transferase [Anaerolineales bacterium]
MSSTEQLITEPTHPKTSSLASKVSRKSQWRAYLFSLLVSDIVLTSTAFWFSYAVRFQMDLPFFQAEAMSSPIFYRRVILVLMSVWCIIFFIAGLYDRNNLLGGTDEYSLIFRATTIGFLLVVIVGFIDPVFIIARGWLLVAWITTFLFAATGRFILRRIVYSLRGRGFYLEPTLIVGVNEEARLLAEQLLGGQTSGLSIVGFIDDHTIPGTSVYRHLLNLGKLDKLDEVISEYDVSELVLATSALTRRHMIEIFKNYGVSNDMNLRLSSGLFEIITTGLTVKETGYVPLVGVNKVRLTGVDKALKMILDYTLTIPGLILLSPLLILIALAVKLDSPGPVIHRRRVMGVGGKTFNAYKFRTMSTDGDNILEGKHDLKERLARDHKLKDDPRITHVGGFLRKYSLDELPQLVNVIRHEMSLVGPRMISPEELTKYNQWGINLLTIPPGITGLWQVSGRSDVSYEDRVRLDMYYIRNWTIWLDLQLLLRTLPAVFNKRGAY